MYLTVNLGSLTYDTAVDGRISRNILRTNNIAFCINLPELLIKVELRNNIDQLHVCFPVRTKSTLIFPVSVKLVSEETLSVVTAIWKNMLSKITVFSDLSEHSKTLSKLSN